MAYEFESSTSTKEYDGKKQIPSIATRLTAEVYFPPKKTFFETSQVTYSCKFLEFLVI